MDIRMIGALLVYTGMKANGLLQNSTPEEKIEMENTVAEKVKKYIQEMESKKS